MKYFQGSNEALLGMVGVLLSVRDLEHGGYREGTVLFDGDDHPHFCWLGNLKTIK